MKITLAVLLILTALVVVNAQQQPEVSDEQLVIQALQGQVQSLSGQLQLQQRATMKLQAQLKDAQAKCERDAK